MYIFIGIVTIICVFFMLRFYLVRHEIRRLHKQIEELSENARYGKRLYLDEHDGALSDAIGAVNRMVDSYENKLRRVEEMERNIRQSISGISHDLRTPLTSLTGYLQLLAKENSPEKGREYLDAIFSSVSTLRDLTENFYELSRLDLEENVLTLQSVNLEHIVSECFLSFYEDFNQRSIELDIKDAETPPVVLADIVALKRVLYNVIQNLLRYASGAVSIVFTSENDHYAVTIANKTTAALPNDINRLFERFYTADPSRKNSGMGLGLYISKKLVEEMGGEIAAHDDNSIFNITIKLPIANI